MASLQSIDLLEIELVLAFPAAPHQPMQDPLFDKLSAHWHGDGLAASTIAIDPGEPEAEALDHYREALRQRKRARHLVIGGFSLGARLAVMSAATIEPLALLCLGYPFHAHGAPRDRHGLRALMELDSPTLIVQGSRDSHGNREEVHGYGPLPPCVELHWLADANHRYRPRQRSPHREDAHIEDAAITSIDFIRRILLSTADA